MTRAPPAVHVDDVFIDVAPPRQKWRFTQRDGETVTLERVDRSGALRFIEVSELLDPRRYLPKRRAAA
ncbi:MAG: hypothetical protein Q8K93_30060 [Reyranella sp.]|uniref:hypothetical protein n=1 Tax=Reyranella sp. TaxID=1929291 RepID=UPI00272F66EA|nr:hypothetical protein [Reyranella sp.]MDP1966435.1 hypothetical protein [Reyranella sp.]MDP2375848.1 hypothetical protein [Reyranella sp.]